VGARACPDAVMIKKYKTSRWKRKSGMLPLPSMEKLTNYYKRCERGRDMEQDVC